MKSDKMIDTNKVENVILSILSDGYSKRVDEIAWRTGLEVRKVNSILASLYYDNKIKRYRCNKGYMVYFMP